MRWEQQVEKRLAALEHRASAMVRLGVAAAVEADPYRVKVRLGPDLVTGPLPVWAPSRSAWAPIQAGDPVAVLSAGGDDAGHFVLGAVPAPRLAGLDAVQVSADEDSRLRIEPGKGRLQADDESCVEVAPGGVKVCGDLTVTGSVTVQGDNVIHGGKNVGRTHRHRGKPATLPTDFTGGPV